MNDPTGSNVSYVERLLEGARTDDGPSEFLYLTRTEGKPGFWELLAFRLPGLDRALVGALHFQAQTDDPLAFARRSLGHFLAQPPQVITTDRSSYPPEVLTLRVPRVRQTLPDLLGALKRDEPTAHVHFDKAHVQVAADFRARNPSLQRSGTDAGPTRRLLLRTGSGHVLRATATNFAVKLRRPGSFLTLTGVEQRPGGEETGSGWVALPTLVLARGFVVAFAELPEGEGDGGELPVTLSARTAAPGHLLDVRLDDADRS